MNKNSWDCSCFDSDLLSWCRILIRMGKTIEAKYTCIMRTDGSLVDIFLSTQKKDYSEKIYLEYLTQMHLVNHLLDFRINRFHLRYIRPVTKLLMKTRHCLVSRWYMKCQWCQISLLLRINPDTLCSFRWDPISLLRLLTSC